MIKKIGILNKGIIILYYLISIFYQQISIFLLFLNRIIYFFKSYILISAIHDSLQTNNTRNISKIKASKDIIKIDVVV